MSMQRQAISVIVIALVALTIGCVEAIGPADAEGTSVEGDGRPESMRVEETVVTVTVHRVSTGDATIELAPEADLHLNRLIAEARDGMHGDMAHVSVTLTESHELFSEIRALRQVGQGESPSAVIRHDRDLYTVEIPGVRPTIALTLTQVESDGDATSLTNDRVAEHPLLHGLVEAARVDGTGYANTTDAEWKGVLRFLRVATGGDTPANTFHIGEEHYRLSAAGAH